ncbi:LacI family transcriptional regulator [Nakamurella flava]|uniref:LacI family transcriptional regulator n=1 Tax=Nakamurella flava TaxID=2576308 RepID=A0A4U6QJN6_9ACTN|nr:LacI family DNA-binding transcriptional regulator [Nakamurella flava]TKV60634.1 LacI family transcriptional regulator [Nakamurella flava]
MVIGPRQDRRPTMNDVAARAQVGLRTVSRYVNGMTNINPEMAERIRSAIEELGYRRNLAAASIRPGQTSGVIGLVIGDLANPYWAALARSVESVAAETGLLLTIASSEEDGARHDWVVERLLQQQVDMIIDVAPRTVGRSWSHWSPPLPPVVFVDRPGDLAGADTVLADNRGGTRDAVAALLAGGARRIAFVGDDRALHTMDERYEGYLLAHAQHGVVVDPTLVFETSHSSGQAVDLVARLLREGRADALFAANNRAAVGALLAFRTVGTRLPIIGFDDFEAAPLFDPPLSVVAQDVEAMGRAAVRAGLDRLQGDDGPARVQVLPTTLQLRGSERP